MSDKFNAYKKANEEVNKNNIAGLNVPLPSINSAKSRVKKQKTVMFTPNQIEKGETYAKQLNMSFSELMGYLIDNVEYNEEN